MERQLVIAGGGIAGLAAAVAARRAGCGAQVLEQVPAFAEVGAGLQFGPNVTRLLRQWPQAWRAVQQAAAAPERLCALDGRTGQALGTLRLGAAFATRYDAPYLTLHRADAHAALRAEASGCGALLRNGVRVDGVREQHDGLTAVLDDGAQLRADGLLGADGLWSRVRELLLGDGPAAFTGHLAYRTLLPQASLPAALRSQDVTVWLAPRMHAVAYPVRAGEWLNLVCLVEGAAPGDPRSWDSQPVAAAIETALDGAAARLRELAAAAPQWRLWALHDRPPVRSPRDLARGRVALAGDAAHPMLPYLAQGAGMAIEDAWTLQQVLAGSPVPQALQRYAQARWHRCARVQARSRRNAAIFHATGPVRAARNAGMRLLGEQVLDLPWLYRGL